MSHLRTPLSVLFALTMGAVAAFSGPRIGIGDPPAGTKVGLTFTFSADQAGGGLFFFTNASGVDFTSLDFFVTEPTGTAITCDPVAFYNHCDVGSVSLNTGQSVFDIGFEARGNATGIPNGTNFSVNLNDAVNGIPDSSPNGAGEWGPGREFDAIANLSAPEPRSQGLMLAAGGLVLLAGLRRWRKAALLRRA